MKMKVRLIDADCAVAGQKVAQAHGNAKELEKHVNGSLSVLHEEGLYAFFLFQQAKDPTKDGVVKALADLLEKYGFKPLADEDLTRRLEKVAEVTEDLRQTLFLRRVLERALIYARWQLKGRADKEKGPAKKGKADTAAPPPQIKAEEPVAADGGSNVEDKMIEGDPN